MILWMFDTSTRELVYCDPQAGALRFSMAKVAEFVCGDYMRAHEDEDLGVRLERDLRKLPRANKSDLVIAGGLRLR